VLALLWSPGNEMYRRILSTLKSHALRTRQLALRATYQTSRQRGNVMTPPVPESLRKDYCILAHVMIELTASRQVPRPLTSCA